MSFAKYCVIYKEFTPNITLNGRNLSRTYKTSLRSFSHFLGSTNQISTVHTVLPWEAFLIFGIYKLDLNRTYKTFLRSFPHFLGSTNQIPTVHTRFSWEAFIIFWDRFTEDQISTVDIRLSWEDFIISEIDLQIRSQPYRYDFL